MSDAASYDADGVGADVPAAGELQARSRHPSNPVDLGDEIVGVIAERMLALAENDPRPEAS